MRTKLMALIAVLAATLFLSACGGDSDTAAAPATVTRSRSRRSSPAPPPTPTTTRSDSRRCRQAESDGAEIAYSESVPVPDIERVLQEYVADGYDVVWTHGSQFYEATAKIAEQNPEVNFIGEFDGQPEGQPENVWIIDRNFHTVFYPLGTLAANLSPDRQGRLPRRPVAAVLVLRGARRRAGDRRQRQERHPQARVERRLQRHRQGPAAHLAAALQRQRRRRSPR